MKQANIPVRYIDYPRETRPYTTAFLSTPKFMFQKSTPPPNFGSWQLKFLMKFAQKVFARYAGAKLFFFFVSDNLLNSKGASHAKEEPTFHGLRTHDG